MQTETRTGGPGVIWLQLAVVYLIAGIALGIYMGANQNFTLRPVHAHLNLLGWATMALAGLIYTVFPAAGLSKLGRAHFWLHNVPFPVMMAALAMEVSGNPAAGPILGIASVAIGAAVLAFAANLFVNLKR